MSSTHSEFPGSHKEGQYLLSGPERQFKLWLAERAAPRISTRTLTLLTIPLSVLAIASGLLAAGDLRFLLLSVVLIACQYLTDLIDGEVGRQSGAGWRRWGYYMDHLCDAMFLHCVLLGFAIPFLESTSAVLSVYALMMASSITLASAFLEFSARGTLHQSILNMGPSAGRVALIALHIATIVIGVRDTAAILPFLATVVWAVALIGVLQAQHRIGLVDRAAMEASDSSKHSDMGRRECG